MWRSMVFLKLNVNGFQKSPIKPKIKIEIPQTQHLIFFVDQFRRWKQFTPLSATTWRGYIISQLLRVQAN
jgi:hypothetical protein